MYISSSFTSYYVIQPLTEILSMHTSVDIMHSYHGVITILKLEIFPSHSAPTRHCVISSYKQT